MPPFLRIGFVILLFALLFPSSIHAQDNATPPPQTRRFRRWVIPFQSRETHGGPIIEVTINEKYKASFLVDTGANNTVLSREFAQRAGLKIEKRTSPGYGAFEATKVENLGIGSLSQEAELLVSQSASLDDLHIDGILGTNFLESFAVLFDFGKQTMSLIYPATLTRTEVRAEGFEHEGQPLLLVPPEDFYFINAKVGEKELPMLIDTGSANTFIPTRLGQTQGRRILGEQDFVTYKGREKIRILVLPEISVANLVTKNIPCSISLEGTVPDAIIGMNILSRCRMLLDYPAKRVYFQSIDDITPTFLANQQKKIDDAIFGPTASGTWKVFSVKKGSIIDKAGILEGDTLVSINKKPFTEILAPELTQIFKQSKKVQMTVRRTVGSEEKQLNITVTY